MAPQSPGRPPAHDYDAILDGEVHFLTYGNDFTCSEGSLRQRLSQAARQRGLSVSVNKLHNRPGPVFKVRAQPRRETQ